MRKLRIIHIFSSVMAIILAAITATYFFCTRPETDKGLELMKNGWNDYVHHNYIPAINKIQKARTIFIELNDSDNIFYSSVYLAQIYDVIGRKKEAYAILKPLHPTSRSARRDYSYLGYLRLLSFYNINIDHNYIEAERLTRKAVEFSMKTYNGSAVFLSDLSNLAELYLKQGNYAKTSEVLARIAEYENSFPDNPGMSGYYNIRGHLAYLNGNIDSAYSYFKKGERIADTLSELDNRLTSLRMLMTIDSIREDFQEYRTHRDSFDQMMLESQNKELYHSLAVAEEAHKVELMQTKARKNYIILGLSVALLILVILIIIFRVRSYRKIVSQRQRIDEMEREELEKKLYYKQLEKELMDLKMQQAQSELDNIKNENLAMSLTIARLDNDDIKSVAPETLLSKLDQEFLGKIGKMFPQLTENDIRMIGYIRHGMTSEAISSLLNITPASINSARYRIRKKLNLTKEQSLDTFIRELI